MFDDRVWVVRFRQETADRLRSTAASKRITVQQLIISMVEDRLSETNESTDSVRRTDQDVYHYGGGPITPSRG